VVAEAARFVLRRLLRDPVKYLEAERRWSTALPEVQWVMVERWNWRASGSQVEAVAEPAIEGINAAGYEINAVATPTDVVRWIVAVSLDVTLGGRALFLSSRHLSNLAGGFFPFFPLDLAGMVSPFDEILCKTSTEPPLFSSRKGNFPWPKSNLAGQSQGTN
jgi:hypothetical protein